MKPFVGKIIEIFCINTARARLEVTFDPLNTQSTEALSTAGYLVRLSKDMEANGTLSWKPLWRIFKKFAFKSGSGVSSPDPRTVRSGDET